MTELEFCKTKEAECNPKDCPIEFCRWRDTVWAVKNLQKWAYNTNITPKIGTTAKEEDTPKES